MNPEAVFGSEYESDDLLDLGALSYSVAEVVQLGASYLADSCHNDLFDVRGVKREGLLDADTVGNTSYGECLGDSAAVLCDNGSLEDLGTGTLALDDAAVDLDVVAYVENGNVLLELLTCKSLDNIHDGSS